MGFISYLRCFFFVSAAALQLSPVDTTRERHRNQNDSFPSLARGGQEEFVNHFLAAQNLMDAASSVGMSSEERAIKAELSHALQHSTVEVGVPKREIAQPEYPGAVLAPDLSKCPVGWTQRGSVCNAGSRYDGPCAPRLELNRATVEGLLAFEKHCKVQFHRQGESSCDQDFAQQCPSLWRETSQDICTAPKNYVGRCSARVNTSGMTEKEKLAFGATCGAPWPCVPPKSHDYKQICPSGWTLQSDFVCVAPSGYSGPCGHVADVRSFNESSKQDFEELCDVSWPDARKPICHESFVAACPAGWKEIPSQRGLSACQAPATYKLCNPVQSFAYMTPSAKRDWASRCAVEFPCKNL